MKWLNLWLCSVVYALMDGAQRVLQPGLCKVPWLRGNAAATFLLQAGPCFGREIRTGLRD